ncbi:MAG: polynucleotide adenylyltransferase [Acidobacteria bacterium]|nr:polynucleotide adenylyltransferase [Acidobacteriota bacterium]
MTEFELAMQIAERIRSADGRALFVGGWVRDRLLGRTSKDIDLEVHGIEAERLRVLLEDIAPVNTVGESFTVYKVGGVDVALPRTESKTGRGHRGFVVTGDPHLSLEEAARRRDFTINAIAWDPETEDYLDPHGGQADLERRQLRIVDPATFADDSLRVLRALQFAARFELTLDKRTRQICRAIPLDDLPAERIWGELEKLLLLADAPSRGFELALELGVVDRLWPELKALVGCEQEPEWHPEGDVWVHTMLVIDEARTRIDDLPRPQQVAVMLGAVCHDLGKPATTEFIDGRIRSRNHEEAGVAPTHAVLDRLNIHTMNGYDVRHQVVGLVAQHLKPGMWHWSTDDVGDGAFRRLARKVDLELLARLAQSDCLGRTGSFDCSAMDWFLDRARALGVEHAPPDPLLLGRHVINLGVAPGPQVGIVLKTVYEQQLDGQVTTLEEAVVAARTILATGQSPPGAGAQS